MWIPQRGKGKDPFEPPFRNPENCHQNTLYEFQGVGESACVDPSTPPTPGMPMHLRIICPIFKLKLEN